MTGGGKFLLGVVALALAVYAGYKLAYPTYSWRQKLTVEVSVDGKSLSASSVTEVKVVYQSQLFFPDAPALRASLEGEAVVLDIPGRGKLFALLGGLAGLAGKTFAGQLPDKATSKERFSSISNLEGAYEVPTKNHPLLVTFTDVDDPRTVKKVDPDNFAKTFGPGALLSRLTLEITDEQVTKGRVAEAFGPEFFRVWAKYHHDALRHGGLKNPYFATFASNLSRNDFVEE